LKYDEKGDISRYKARLVAQGFSQQPGIDYNETLAPVAQFELFRTVLMLVAVHDLKLKQIDVKSAYLNGILDEEIYMKQPLGFETTGAEHLVLRLRKGLYGLKQARCIWNKTFNASLIGLGFSHTYADPCVYYRRIDNNFSIIATHVDDSLLATNSPEEMSWLKQQLHSLPFEFSELGEPKVLLGIVISHD